MVKRYSPDDRQRSLLAHECAKIIATEGVKDFAKAKRKAVARLGLSTSRALLPSNLEIEQALHSYQRLFLGDQQAHRLRILREAALQVMLELVDFRPRLVGAVLQGSANTFSAIELHVFANTPEDIIFFLLERNTSYATGSRRIRLQHAAYADFPTVGFAFGEFNVDLTVFWQRSERDIPYSPIDGKPMQRAKTQAIERLLNEI